MQEATTLLQANRSGFLATVDAGQPRVRPFQFQFVEQGKFYFCTAKSKDVYKQLQATPTTEFSATSPKMETVRLRGAVKFSDDRQLKQRILDNEPMIRILRCFILNMAKRLSLIFPATRRANICFNQSCQTPSRCLTATPTPLCDRCQVQFKENDWHLDTPFI